MTPTIVTKTIASAWQLVRLVAARSLQPCCKLSLMCLNTTWTLVQVVSASRIHHQWLPDELRVEPFGLDIATIQELRRRGHNIKKRSPWG